MTSTTSDLASRTAQQTSALEISAGAMRQLTGSIDRSAGGATRAQSIVKHAKTEAERSEHVVRDAITAMTVIEESSARIEEIIDYIDRIAAQTNLLAPTRRSRRRAPTNLAAASPSLRRRCATSPSIPPTRRSRSGR